jgi:hypothetical protein
MYEKTLYWKKGNVRRTYEIWQDQEKVGALVWPGAFSQTAMGHLFGKRYLLKTKGFFNTKLYVFVQGQTAPVEVVSLNDWSEKGKVLGSSAEDIRWKFRNFFRKEWAWVNGSSAEIHFRKKSTFFREKGAIVLHERFDPEYEYRILSGLYLRTFYDNQFLVS